MLLIFFFTSDHVISKSKMLDLIFSSVLLDKLCVNIENNDKKWRLRFYNTAPLGWVKVKSNLIAYSKQNLLKHITMINTLSPESIANPTDSRLRWKDLGPVFDKAGTSLVLYKNYTRMHLQAMFESALEENVQYLEARVSGLGMYILDDSADGGVRIIDNEDGDLWFHTVIEEVEKFKRANTEFIGYKEIISGRRSMKPDQVDAHLQRVFRLRQKYPQMVQGVDLVAEEDSGYSLLFFIDEFADMHAENKVVPLYLHNGETNWPDDLMTSLHPLDPVSTLENIYEAILLGAKRVGHGLGFIKHPYLMQVLKEKQIAIEVNPVSNMILGYVTDQRQHPAVTYMRYGIPIVLGADDPGTMGYDEFTVDWYEAFMAWGLRLSDLRSLALNSLRFSMMSSNEKLIAEAKYNKNWNKFVKEMKSEACSTDFTSPGPVVNRIFPNEGAISGSTIVRVFGRNFQMSICEKIICRFGKQQSDGRYIYNSLIMCDATGHGTAEEVDFSISLNSGKHFIQTNMTFEYKHEQELKTSGGHKMTTVFTCILISFFISHFV